MNPSWDSGSINRHEHFNPPKVLSAQKARVYWWTQIFKPHCVHYNTWGFEFWFGSIKAQSNLNYLLTLSEAFPPHPQWPIFPSWNLMYFAGPKNLMFSNGPFPSWNLIFFDGPKKLTSLLDPKTSCVSMDTRPHAFWWTGRVHQKTLVSKILDNCIPTRGGGQILPNMAEVATKFSPWLRPWGGYVFQNPKTRASPKNANAPTRLPISLGFVGHG